MLFAGHADAFIVAANTDVAFIHSGSLLQVSGLSITYDLTRPEGQRLVSLEKNGAPVADTDRLMAAAPGFLAEGGDLYTIFAEVEAIRSVGKVADVAAAYFADHEVVDVPSRGRQVNLAR